MEKGCWQILIEYLIWQNQRTRLCFYPLDHKVVMRSAPDPICLSVPPSTNTAMKHFASEFVLSLISVRRAQLQKDECRLICMEGWYKWRAHWAALHVKCEMAQCYTGLFIHFRRAKGSSRRPKHFVPSFLPVMSRCSVLTASCTSGCATSLPTVPELEALALTPPPSFQRQLGASRLFAKVLTAFGHGWEMWECSVTHVLPAGCFGNC